MVFRLVYKYLLILFFISNVRDFFYYCKIRKERFVLVFGFREILVHYSEKIRFDYGESLWKRFCLFC